MMGIYQGYGNGYDAQNLIFMLFMNIAIIVGIILLVRYLVGTRHNLGKEETALDLLKKRYAKGEIDKKEFEEKRKDLEI